jgi:agmatinase
MMAGLKGIADVLGTNDVDTFLGVPTAPVDDLGGAAMAIIGAPTASPYKQAGAYCARAPEAIRRAIAPYAGNLHHFDFDLGGQVFPDGNVTAVDCGNLECGEQDGPANRDLIRSTVQAMLEQNAVPVVIGGDDSVPIPVLQAFEGRGDLTILQIDAHIDWRDEVHGEPWGLSSTMRRASEMPHIKNIVQVGMRAIGSARPGEVDDALQWGAKLITAQQINAHGIGLALDLIPDGANVVISLDCDGLDQAVIPGVIGRAPGGLTYWDTIGLIHGVAKKARIAGFNIVEFVPELDVDGLGALVAARLISNVLGTVARVGTG